MEAVKLSSKDLAAIKSVIRRHEDLSEWSSAITDRLGVQAHQVVVRVADPEGYFASFMTDKAVHFAEVVTTPSKFVRPVAISKQISPTGQAYYTVVLFTYEEEEEEEIEE